MTTKLGKHALMRALRKIHNEYFEIIRFFIKLGRFPDLLNPRTISEFLVSRKLQKDFPDPQLCGKLEGYEFFKKAVAFIDTPEVVLSLGSGDLHLLHGLSDGNYLVKASNSSGGVAKFSVTDGIPSTSYQALRKLAERWLDQRYDEISGEFFYAFAKPKILIEKNVLHGDTFACDLKVHCSRGRACIVQFIDRNHGNMKRFTWVKIGDTFVPKRLYKGEVSGFAKVVEREKLLEACEAAEIVSREMDYVRVDFILGEEATLYFVELTFLPAGGTMPLVDAAADAEFFDVLQIGSLKRT